MITIGPWTIMRMNDGSIWIRHQDGEGGTFDETELAKHLEKFYQKFF